MDWKLKALDANQKNIDKIVKENSIEVKEINNEKYYRIKPEDINTGSMALVEKGTDVVVFRVQKGSVLVTTKQPDSQIIFAKYANEGDFVVCNIGAVEAEDLVTKIVQSPKKILSKQTFETLYNIEGIKLTFTGENLAKILNKFRLDNQNNENFDESNFLNPTRHANFGKKVNATVVNFNFIIDATWGEEQFIKKGGILIHNPHTSTEKKKDIYGVSGGKNRKAGQFEKTYGMSEREGKARGLIEDTYKMVIKSDMSPLPGIQFNKKELAEAYAMIGKATHLQHSLIPNLH
jgi:hypothetical protein